MYFPWILLKISDPYSDHIHAISPSFCSIVHPGLYIPKFCWRFNYPQFSNPVNPLQYKEIIIRIDFHQISWLLAISAVGIHHGLHGSHGIRHGFGNWINPCIIRVLCVISGKIKSQFDKKWSFDLSNPVSRTSLDLDSVRSQEDLQCMLSRRTTTLFRMTLWNSFRSW